jgi:hypothetical protein
MDRHPVHWRLRRRGVIGIIEGRNPIDMCCGQLASPLRLFQKLCRHRYRRFGSGYVSYGES